jgi:rubrerythrin
MYEDLIDKEEHYYMGSYLKPSYRCEPCNLSMTTLNNKETEECPLCKAVLTKELVPITFSQKHNYATYSC